MKNLIAAALILSSTSPLLAQGIDFQLVKAYQRTIPGYCTLVFEVRNRTNLNITNGMAKMTLRERDGTIHSKEGLVFGRIKSGDSVGADRVVGAGELGCKPIHTIQIQIDAVEVDGTFLNWADDRTLLNRLDSGDKSSRVPGIILR